MSRCALVLYVQDRKSKYFFDEENKQRWEKFDKSHWLPMQPVANLDPNIKHHYYLQLALYDPNIKHNYYLLSDTGMIVKSQKSKFCAGNMHFEKLF